jgi:nucleotide-binding universal stress UspA family protein
MKILLAVDGSKTSLDAVKFVIKHAHWFREQPSLEVVSAHAQISVPHLLDQAGIRYEARVLVGNLAEVITKHAKKTGCDLIVVGAPQAIIGSVSSKVMHLSEVPVLMVK